MQLALGTVQFGLGYGVAGRDTPVPAPEVRAILVRAQALGVRVLDTAAAYGDIEPRLAALAEGLGFNVVSKLPACPAGLADAAAADWAVQMLERSCERLGPSLQAVLFHRADDLLGPNGSALWDASAEFAQARGLQLGVSVYDATTLLRITARFAVALAQLPGNALDQGLRLLAEAKSGSSTLPELHLRSAFLQGLLLMPQAQASQRVPAAAAALARWHSWCQVHGHSPLQAALGIVKGLPGVTHCVVGVDGLAQLEATAAAWQAAPVLQAPALATADTRVTDPRLWPARD
jgi:aryl-alcohol dehydrogenase-like predicted oxidoreductase